MNALQTHIDNGTLIRHRWTGRDAQGRETACLLAALSPECERAQDPGACPAHIMPQWLAHLTPWIDDTGSVEAWPAMVQRYANVAQRWSVLNEEQWDAAHKAVHAVIVREAMRHTTATGVLAICENIARTLESGQWPSAAARTAADAAAWAADDAANAAVWAADNTVDTARAAAWAAADAAARTAADAAAAADDAADAARAAAWTAADTTDATDAADAAAWAAADRIIDAILTILEKATT